ncbi:Probable beta-galactosidase [Sparassis crispa]|uniref:beta-galactosidase n=1 Tax=Sparassis crispa TaxID=139825 RepID=A0A401G9T2_9APHY|nr:Probable beta-galactosidase [Sparassis crispa]GBE78934.1 Probable beta-galactosidase [Sparassis crispa]
MLWHHRSSWAFPAFLSLFIVFFTWPFTLRTAASTRAEYANLAAASPTLKSDNLTDVVQWDNYSLFVYDQRIFLHSGEMATFRLPIPDLWLDIFQKMVAAGLNAVSIYIHWGLTNPAPGVLDFNDWRALQPFFDAAKLAGLWIVLRPGPYINAETTAGGIPHWVTSLVAGQLRTNASDYEAAWQPYIARIAENVIPNQVSSGGPILAVQVDNEYYQDAVTGEYFAELEAAYRSAGVVIPLTYNDPGEGSNFINGTGAVNIYGLDSYPQGFDCSHPEQWASVVTNYHQYHEEVDPGEPWYMPEFQGAVHNVFMSSSWQLIFDMTGGAFDPWGGPGYNNCEILTGADFMDVFYKQNWASNVKLISYYTVYGGTSWGGLPEPSVYSSYDYGASIRESRLLSDKYDEIKRQGIFIRSSPSFRKTDWVGDTSTTIPGVTVNGSGAYVTLLYNYDTGTGFYIARQADSTSTTNINFTLTVPTSAGTLTIPSTSGAIALDGRQSKVIVTDYAFGAQSSVLYSTASIFYAGTIGARDVLFLYGDATQSHEVALVLNGSSAQASDVSYSNAGGAGGITTVTFLPGITGLVTVWDSATQLILYADPITTATFWAPAIPTAGASTDFPNYFQFGTNETVLIGGPYLVRNASIADGELALRGDLNASIPLTVVAPPEVTRVSWNGVPVELEFASADGGAQGGVLAGSLQMSTALAQVTVPALTGWRYNNSLPEVLSNYSDAEWVVANHTTTNIPAMLYGDGRVLYGCDYGYCENAVLWRGHFEGTGSETSVNLTINGGTAFGATVYLNDVFLNSTYDISAEQTTELYTFPPGSVQVGQDNVITVVQDSSGNDEDANEKSPRGIPGFQLNGGNFTVWKVQGKLGGYMNYPDKVRGVLNEGGFYGEREGWHLPGFDTSSWTTRELTEGLPGGGPGIGFFVTTFDLAVPANSDVLMSFQYDTSSQPYRAQLYVNGWYYGKRVANFGPQTNFPVSQGILNYSGTNTVAVALWSMENTPVSPTLALQVNTVIEGGVGAIALNNPGWTPRPSAS